MACKLHLLLLITLLVASVSYGEDPTEPHLPSNTNEEASVSPKKGWGDFPVNEEEVPDEESGLRTALLWLPNRLLDLVDVFKIDVGVGPAAGGVVRLTKWGQAGYRNMAPGSLRVGDFGRSSPVVLESSNEFGAGPAFVASKDRKVCPGEVGVGLDIFIVGGYAGICFDELADFVGGVFLLDMKDDDLK